MMSYNAGDLDLIPNWAGDFLCLGLLLRYHHQQHGLTSRPNMIPVGYNGQTFHTIINEQRQFDQEGLPLVIIQALEPQCPNF